MRWHHRVTPDRDHSFSMIITDVMDTVAHHSFTMMCVIVFLSSAIDSAVAFVHIIDRPHPPVPAWTTTPACPISGASLRIAPRLLTIDPTSICNRAKITRGLYRRVHRNCRLRTSTGIDIAPATAVGASSAPLALDHGSKVEHASDASTKQQHDRHRARNVYFDQHHLLCRLASVDATNTQPFRRQQRSMSLLQCYQIHTVIRLLNSNLPRVIPLCQQ
jgi:hypothetical protein